MKVSQGFQIVSNQYFLSGLTNYAVYDLNGTGNISLSVVTDPNAPGGSGKKLKITVAGGGEAPGLGGFYYSLGVSGVLSLDNVLAGDTYVASFWANIPLGFNINFNNNSLGSGGSVTLLSSSNAGTGGWTYYSWKVVTGSGIAAGAFPYFYLSGSFSSSFTWYVAQLSIVDGLTAVGLQNILMISNLANNSGFYTADLVTVSDITGRKSGLTTADKDITFNSILYSSQGPYPMIEDLKWSLGLAVDVVKITLLATPAMVFNHVTNIFTYAAAGWWDDCVIQVERLFMPTWGDTSAGSVILFKGNVADITEINRYRVVLEVRSRLQLLTQPMPAQTYQPGCRFALYGPGCDLNINSFLVNGSISSVTDQILFNTNLTQADGYFNEGMMGITQNGVGWYRTIRNYVHASGQILLYKPFPVFVSGGSFFAWPGCDKTLPTCTNKFSNAVKFGGFPYIPVPETGV